jgi:hypothetical protein
MTGKKVDKTGRTTHVPADHRQAKANRAPRGEPWVWITRSMLGSPAWAAMSLAAHKIVERIAIEHMSHAGTANGKLVVTFSDFERFGIRRASIADAVAEATGLGWIDVVEHGRAGLADFRFPSEYRLTWLPGYDGYWASNRWKEVKTSDQAQAVLARIHRTRAASRAATADKIEQRKIAKAARKPNTRPAQIAA